MIPRCCFLLEMLARWCFCCSRWALPYMTLSSLRAVWRGLNGTCQGLPVKQYEILQAWDLALWLHVVWISKKKAGLHSGNQISLRLPYQSWPVCLPSPASHSNLLNTCLFVRTWCLFQGAKGWLFISTPAATIARGTVFFELSICPSVCLIIGKFNSQKHHHGTT